MKTVLIIAGDEWRYWLRSRLALWGIALFTVLLIATGTLPTMQILDEQHVRQHHQAQAEETFLAQPDRHPHRMVHYGHYAFRAPTPLAILDPGLDTVTGQSIFLEGHRQNTAMFADAGASADFGGLSWLSPARVYQLFGPLLLILLGYGAVVREREASTLSTLLLQGVRGRQILAGKLLALLSLTIVLLTPLFITASIAEGVAAGASLTATYLAYLGIWAAGTLLVSAVFHKRAVILATLTMLWLCLCLLVPSIAVDAESRSSAHAGKIETDLAMLEDIRKLGDGHNADDPAFAEMRANLLNQYQVERVEDLPVNLRGVVALYSEEKLTDTLNAYARTRMAGEARQVRRLQQYGWLSPALAVASASRAVSATDLDHYHRFLNEAEALRYAFVQALNDVHAKQLAYTDDINRSSDADAERRTRVSAENWQVLDEFRFEPAGLTERIHNAGPSLLMLIAWLGALLGSLLWAGRSLRP